MSIRKNAQSNRAKLCPESFVFTCRVTNDSDLRLERQRGTTFATAVIVVGRDRKEQNVGKHNPYEGVAEADKPAVNELVNTIFAQKTGVTRKLGKGETEL